MHLHSPEFIAQNPIPSTFTCDGKNVHPTLLISEAPNETKSFAIIVDDINSVKGVWVHWSVWDIPANTTRIEEGEVLAGAVEGMTDFGTIGYGGPCPVVGEHMYVFRLYALDVMLRLPAGASRSALDDAMNGHVLAQTELPGRYRRTKN